MNDDEFGGIVGTALRERFPLPDNVDLLPRLTAPVARRPRLRPMLAIAATVLVVAAVAVVLALRGTTKHAPAAATYGLDGITWEGAAPQLTVVFTGDAIRIDDGCSNELHQVTIGDSWLRIGDQIGKASTCGGTAPPIGGASAPPSPADMFDRVVYSNGELTWQRNGDTLELTNARGDNLELHANGPALSVSGQTWSLAEYVDAREYSHEGDFSGATFRIDQDGAVHAIDLCRDLTGSAAVTDTTVTFTDMHLSDGACSDDASAAAEVVDHVLNGSVEYSINGNELVLYTRGQGLLIYKPAS